jgi:hypothetical protein
MQMNHTTLAIVGMLAIAAALVGAIAVSVLLPAAHAASYPQKDPGKKNSIDIEKSTTDFSFKQKLKNNCSGFATCTNTARELLAGP